MLSQCFNFAFFANQSQLYITIEHILSETFSLESVKIRGRFFFLASWNRLELFHASTDLKTAFPYSSHKFVTREFDSEL